MNDLKKYFQKNDKKNLHKWLHYFDIYKEKIQKVKVSYWAKNIQKISFYNSVIVFKKKYNQIPRNLIK